MEYLTGGDSYTFLGGEIVEYLGDLGGANVVYVGLGDLGGDSVVYVGLGDLGGVKVV